MPVQKNKEAKTTANGVSRTPGSERYFIGLVGNGSAMEILGRVFEREDFISAFPNVKIVGWVPSPNSALASAPDPATIQTPAFLRKQPVFESMEKLFAARPGINLALDMSDDHSNTAKLRAIAPIRTTIGTVDSIVQFCAAAEDGRLAIGGGEGLRKAKNLFALLMDQMDDDIFILDPAGVIIEMNRYAAESREVNREDYIGRPCCELDSSLPCLEDHGSCSFCTARSTGKKAEKFVNQLMPDGKMRHLNTFCFPIINQDNVPAQFLYVRRDVTERIQMEQRLQKSEKMVAIGELSTYMAHEIRNPLFSIGGFANALLRNASLDEQSRAKAQIIYEESRRLDVILTNILNFARPTDQKIGIFDVGPVITQTVNLLSFGSDERGLVISMEMDPKVPKVQGNAENLKQCLINLMKNALEAMPNGGKLTIRTNRGEGGVRIEVEDTGTGIPPELCEQVFSPFFSTKHEGAGLGLAMTRKIIDEMGGKLLLKSIVNSGTTFTIILAAALAVD